MLNYNAATGTLVCRAYKHCGLFLGFRKRSHRLGGAGEEEEERSREGEVQMIPHTVNSICDDRCDRLHSAGFEFRRDSEVNYRYIRSVVSQNQCTN